MNAGPDTILVLAGSRGPADPLAQHAGVAHKCLIPIGGVAMIDRVVGVLRRLEGAPRIVIATDRPDMLESLPEIDTARADGRLHVMAAADSPSRTVLAAIARGHVAPPFLVTTADHPLLTAEIISHFWSRVPSGADAAAAVASATTIRHAWPEARRTYLPFRDGGYSGCNLFALMTPGARTAVEFWQRAEARRKQPLAMIRLLGPAATIRFLLGLMSLEMAVDHLGRLTGTRLAAIALPFPEAAVDVDKPEDIVLAQQILDRRNGGGAALAPAMDGRG